MTDRPFGLSRKGDRLSAFAALACALLLPAFAAWAQQTEAVHRCGPIQVPLHYGPYDYRNERHKLIIVESAHFTPSVEALIAGSTGDLNKDLNYTLLSSPNHHRALVSLSRLSTRTKDPQPRGFSWPIECYFERALRFRADDSIVRMIFAQYLGQHKRVDEAVVQLNAVLQASADNPLTQYNAGLIFFDMGLYDRALTQAHVARKMGLERPDLADMLKKANRWQEPKE